MGGWAQARMGSRGTGWPLLQGRGCSARHMDPHQAGCRAGVAQAGGWGSEDCVGMAGCKSMGGTGVHAAGVLCWQPWVHGCARAGLQCEQDGCLSRGAVSSKWACPKNSEMFILQAQKSLRGAS